MINKTIFSDFSYNKEESGKVKSSDKTGLKDSEHFSSMSFNNNHTQNFRKNRNRKVIWFNPQYSRNVRTIIGKLFIKLVRKYFPNNNKYHKVFNSNALTLSYCCTTNVGSILKQHNSKVLSKTTDNSNRRCNCNQN